MKILVMLMTMMMKNMENVRRKHQVKVVEVEQHRVEHQIVEKKLDAHNKILFFSFFF